MKEKLSIINGKPSFPRKCTYGSNGQWELHVYTNPKKITREKFDQDCKPGTNREDIGQVQLKEILDRLHIYIGHALGSQEDPCAELASLLAPKFDDARVFDDDGKNVMITAETKKDFFLFRYTTR